jgi:hypothetical protein
MLSYGEDAVTFWALKNQLNYILETLEDQSIAKDCKIFFRPSFGRRGGHNSSQFGEFDFIILSKKCIYLGESKWESSSEYRGESLFLREEQKNRHKIFMAYVHKWFEGNYHNWAQFTNDLGEEIIYHDVKKKVAPPESILAEHLFSMLEYIKRHFNSEVPDIVNVLLYLYNGNKNKRIPSEKDEGFELVIIDFSTGLSKIGNFIDI